MDARFDLIRTRLRTLTLEELQLIRDAIECNQVCYDTFNYDKSTGLFCPLAIAKGYHLTDDFWSDEIVQVRLMRYFNPVNALKGTPGRFYTTHRKEDLHFLIHEVIAEKRQQKTLRRLTDIIYKARLALSE
jgi:hypothetical protein